MPLLQEVMQPIKRVKCVYVSIVPLNILLLDIDRSIAQKFVQVILEESITLYQIAYDLLIEELIRGILEYTVLCIQTPSAGATMCMSIGWLWKNTWDYI